MESKIISKVGQIVNVFETGALKGNYAQVTILNDGKFPNGKRGMPQITYGSKQTTEQENLIILIQMYVDAQGLYAELFKPYLSKIGKQSLVKDKVFIDLLKKAGTDPIMVTTQDVFFEEVYMKPAKKWCNDMGLVEPLSFAVVFDSFIHSGKIRDDIRNMPGFTAVPPALGGNEREWITQYVKFRGLWLLSKSDPVLQRTIYRMKTFEKAIEMGNWDLSQVVYANGISIKSLPFKMALIEPPKRLRIRA